jgi:hypothetical protein
VQCISRGSAEQPLDLTGEVGTKRFEKIHTPSNSDRFQPTPAIALSTRDGNAPLFQTVPILNFWPRRWPNLLIEIGPPVVLGLNRLSPTQAVRWMPATVAWNCRGLASGAQNSVGEFCASDACDR